ncbi:response regulator [candidate division KSB1 bacterium]|nr:response regulator [candidate division KSB1 bacterium]
MKKVKTILIVEDEALTALYLKLELERAGYRVCNTVATGEEAILCATKDQPDIILMDIRLAGNINGIEAAQTIRSNNDVPIIFMTGYHEEKLRERAKPLNPLGYFIKPVGLSELKLVINGI